MLSFLFFLFISCFLFSSLFLCHLPSPSPSPSFNPLSHRLWVGVREQWQVGNELVVDKLVFLCELYNAINDQNAAIGYAVRETVTIQEGLFVTEAAC